MFFGTLGDNSTLLEELYKQYQENPHALDPSWKTLFDSLDKESPAKTVYPPAERAPADDLRIYNLIEAYRTYGHLLAKINPIALTPPEEPWQLKLEHLHFSPEDLDRRFPTLGLLPQPQATLREMIDTLQRIYCNRIGVEYMGLGNPDLEKWLQNELESHSIEAGLTVEQKKMILQQLNRSELLESFIHTKYTGQKRFSLEGGETLIPMIESIIETGSQLGLDQFIIGMAHRGRLNVLANILKKSYADLFSEFEEGYIPDSFEGSGDVKYHKGFSSEVTLPSGKEVKIIVSHNPSHLESVDPVVEGMVHAKQRELGNQNSVIPLLVHGEAAIAGQGMVYETLQLCHIPGYSTGGTIHIVINNQIGFTATPEETRSTRYCTDIARTFSAPVFHVNAEDPEACVYATNLAVKMRQRFHCDLFIDLYCYRKYGHNETDEPAFTQPLEYQIIRKKRPIREIYRDHLIHEGVVEKHIAESLEQEFTKELHQALEQSKESLQKPAKEVAKKENALSPTPKTGASKEILLQITERISQIPEGFTIHPKLQHLIQERLGMVKEQSKPIDWGMAETLAYGSLLWEGISVRLSGQDVCRGTFSHRHAVWIDQKIEQGYIPLQHLKQNQGHFDIYNSPLSEYGVLGFELGYSIAAPQSLTIWEAQFGDFANGAQVMMDQYISTGEQKWGQTSGLVLLLPHGYEGQGPEHSSGRIERFLTLSGEDNLRIVYPTTPSQFFHLLRKQALDSIKKPLVVFTPKGLLRHPACISKLEELTEGSFQTVLDDPSPGKQVNTLFLCSGRIYYDLISEREKQQRQDIAIVRIEQLSPLDEEALTKIMKKYSSIKECIWIQEEPLNMGAWEFMRSMLLPLIPKSVSVTHVGRPRSASPAVGSYSLHKKQHAQLMEPLKIKV